MRQATKRWNDRGDLETVAKKQSGFSTWGHYGDEATESLGTIGYVRDRVTRSA